MEMGIINTKKINEIRQAIFETVANEITNDWVSRIQPLIGVWKSDAKFNASKKHFNISETGVLSLPIFICEEKRITCSVFMFLGEIRIGIVTDNEKDFILLKQNSANVVYDQHPIFKQAGDSFMMDWVFRDKWIADTSLMSSMLTNSNPNLIGAIADAIAKQTIHIIISSVVAISSIKKQEPSIT